MPKVPKQRNLISGDRLCLTYILLRLKVPANFLAAWVCFDLSIIGVQGHISKGKIDERTCAPAWPRL